MGWLLVVAGFLAAITGCGGSSVSDQPAGAGSSGEGHAGSAGEPPVPALGECVEALHLEGTSADNLDSLPTRLRGGFAFFDRSPHQEFGWLLATEDNDWHDVETKPAFSPYLTPLPAGSAESPRLVLFDRELPQGYDGQLLAQAVKPDGSSIAPLGPVLSVFDRGTAAYPVATALDGERVAVGNGHVATRDPHFVLLDKNAQPVSDEIRLFDSGDHPLFDCFTLTGTAHGVLASVVDTDTHQIHLLELDASGAHVNEATAPVPADSSCPRITVDPTGNYLSFQVGLETTNDGPRLVFRLADHALTDVATLASSPEHTSYVWIAGGDEPLVGIFDDTDESRAVSFARLKNGALLPLQGTFSGVLVPSAEGRIFLVSNESVDVLAGPDFTIVEVACGAASD